VNLIFDDLFNEGVIFLFYFCLQAFISQCQTPMWNILFIVRKEILALTHI